MAAFEYIALDERGRKKKGILEADSSRQVRQMIRDMGLFPTFVEATVASSQTEMAGSRRFLWKRKLPVVELAMFTRQLATLTNAGLPVEQALAAVAEQTHRKRARSVFMAVRSRVLEGRTLTSSMSEYPAIFDELYRSSVAAGEQSGHLDSVLLNLADFLERRLNSRRNLESALYYPIVLLSVAILIVIGLMSYVVPKIVDVFAESGSELPRLTIFLIATSEFLREWYVLLLLGIILIVIALRYLLTIPSIRLSWHRLKLNLPFVGWFTRGSNATRYAHTLSILGKSGVPLVDGMYIAKDVVTNQWIQQRLLTAFENVQEGTSLHAALDATDQFPPIFVHMIASGELSGALDDMLDKCATYQQQDLEKAVDTAVQLFRPLVLVIMAGLVLLIMLAILLPILNMNQMVI